MNIHTQPVSATNADKARLLVKICEMPDTGRDAVAEALGHQRDMILATVDGSPVGMLSIEGAERHGDPSSTYVFGLFVVSSQRSSGIATTLMSSAEQIAGMRTHDSIELHVATDNLAAIRLYEKLGYKPQGQDRTYASLENSDKSGHKLYRHYRKPLSVGEKAMGDRHAD